MTPIEVRPESYSYVFNPYLEPIARVQPGERGRPSTATTRSRAASPRRPTFRARPSRRPAS